MNNWWNNFFDEKFADLLLGCPNPERLKKEVAFLISELSLEAGQVVFDQCCGSGEISCALAKEEMRMIGVDQSKPYITRAKHKAEQSGLPCEFYEGDALNFKAEKACDAAFNWYTSFGYSDNDSVNQQMLQCAYDSLKKGGKFVLDYTNPAFIFKHFTEHKVIKMPNQQEVLVLKESKTDLERGMLISNWTYVLEDGTRETKTGESRIYFARDLKELLEGCGFRKITFKGGISGEPLTKDSSRCIVTAQKA
jgi:ubiquinone/menaquinone biosynthesis C-methylase UbiE